MPDFEFYDFLVVGDIATEFIIDLHNQSHPGVVGGSLMYATGGLRCWNDRIAIVSKTLPKHHHFLEKIQRIYKIDIQGVRYKNNCYEDRQFLGYISPTEVVVENPVAYYSSKKLLFPKELVGYKKKEPESQIYGESMFFPDDFPICYHDITSALICPTNINTQIQLSCILLNTSVLNLVIQSSSQFMNMTNFETLPVLMKNLTAFITTSDQINNLFRNRSTDLWEMADHLCSLGCEYVVIFDEVNGFILFDRKTNLRIQSPAYPSKVIDPTGLLPSFCGGFMAGFKKNYDPVEALTHGIVSASVTCEGSHPFYTADVMPGLLHNRLKLIHELVKKS